MGEPSEYTELGVSLGPLMDWKLWKQMVCKSTTCEGMKAQALEGGLPEQRPSPGIGSGQREKEVGEGSGLGTEVPSGSQLRGLHLSLTPGPVPTESWDRAS